MTDEKIENVVSGEEPFLGALDIALLVILIAGGTWYFTRNRTKPEEQGRTYSIQ